jgi:predicted transcriptional regulator
MKKIEQMIKEGKIEAIIRDAVYEYVKNGEITCDDVEKIMDQIESMKKNVKELQKECVQ